MLGSNCIGERGVTSEQVAQQCVEKLVNQITAGGCVDEHVQDQLIIFMGLAAGISTIRTGPLTEHTNTAIHFVEMLLGVCRSIACYQYACCAHPSSCAQAKFTVTPSDNDTFLIACEGVGYMPPGVSGSDTATAPPASSSSSSGAFRRA